MKDVWEDGVAEGRPVPRSIYRGRQLDPSSQRRVPLLPLVLPVGLMRVSLFLIAFLMGISALAPEANAQRRASGEATHSVTLFFDEADAALSPARIEVKPQSERTRAPWGREIRQMALLTNKGHIILIDEFLSSGHTTGFHASTFIPTGETVQFILMRGENTLGWKVEEDWPAFAETKWTLLDQDGTPTTAERRVGSGEMQNNALCNGIVDPWTGECFEEIRDPWGVKIDDQRITIEI